MLLTITPLYSKYTVMRKHSFSESCPADQYFILSDYELIKFSVHVLCCKGDTLLASFHLIPRVGRAPSCVEYACSPRGCVGSL